MELKNIDLTNKCGSCDYFNPIDGTAMGECRKNPYDENVVHDPKHPYWIVARSRIKCRAYKSHCNKPQPTNADRFRSMSDEEQQKCVRRFWEIEDFADWLKQPAQEEL